MSNYSFIAFIEPPFEPDLTVTLDNMIENVAWDYEAVYAVPLFWLCFFDAHGNSAVGVPAPSSDFPFFFAPRRDALKNAERRRSQLSGVLDGGQLRLFDLLVERLRTSFPCTVILNYHELAMMEGEEGAQTGEILRAFEAMDATPAQEWTAREDRAGHRPGAGRGFVLV